MTDPGRVVVLGGSGFLGRHIAAAFAATGREVLAVSRNPRSGPHRVRHLAMDLCTEEPPQRLGRVLRDVHPAVVVNAVGVIWAADERALAQTNTRTAQQVVEGVAALPYRPRLLHIGTVYEHAPSPLGKATGVDTPELPISAYGRTKLLGSRAVLNATADGRVDGAVLRPSVVVGPGIASHSLLGRVADELAGMREGGSVVLRPGHLSGRRDFIDVRDVAAAVVAAASAMVTGQVIPLGRGEAVPVRRLVEMLVAVSGMPAVVEETVQERTVPARRSGADWLCVDISTAQRTLGWRPSVSLEDSVRSLWEERTSPGTTRPVPAGEHPAPRPA
ncbi:NAD-dependent epimerase/dehydratase family protein [Streptomyces sp. UG1]|uniref:NAD-dependent epimerase/dehydratase family protein n=1 Tax=Streptomyces sp. UG1 TaxID=3417652 RepID=UPI003CF24F18